MFDNQLSFQSVLFLKPDEHDSGGTLSGNKKEVYVLMKILKKCHEDVNITSFKVKLKLFHQIKQNFHQHFFLVDEICSRQVSGGEEV